MILLDMSRIRLQLESGPDFWQPLDIGALFNMNWRTILSTPGIKLPPKMPGLGYHRNAVWDIAQQRQRVAVEWHRTYQEQVRRQQEPNEVEEHEWCDSRIIHQMLQRWSQEGM